MLVTLIPEAIFRMIHGAIIASCIDHQTSILLGSETFRGLVSVRVNALESLPD